MLLTIRVFHQKRASGHKIIVKITPSQLGMSFDFVQNRSPIPCIPTSQVSPSEREPAFPAGDRRDGIQQVAGGSGQPVKPRSHHHIAGIEGKAVEHLAMLNTPIRHENDRYPFTPRISTPRAIVAKLRPEPPREPLPLPKVYMRRRERLRPEVR